MIFWNPKCGRKLIKNAPFEAAFSTIKSSRCPLSMAENAASNAHVMNTFQFRGVLPLDFGIHTMSTFS